MNIKKVMNLTKGKISKLHKKNKQTRKKRISNDKNRKHRNSYTFRKKRWIDLSNKTLKNLKMTGGNNDYTKLDIQEQQNEKQIQNGPKLEMPEITHDLSTQEKISEEVINDLPEEMLEEIASGSIFEPEDQSSVTEIEEPQPEPLQDRQQKEYEEKKLQEEPLNSNPFDSVNNVAHIFASSSSTTPLPLPVYGGKKRRFRLTKKSK